VGGHLLALAGPKWFGIDATANTAAMIAVTAGGIFFLTVLFAPENGLLARAFHRLSLTTQIARQDILGVLYRARESAGTDRGGSMSRDDLLGVFGFSTQARWAVRSLLRRGEVIAEGAEGSRQFLRLSETGAQRAARLVGSHRLWEVYLARHFQLASDHLHEPAERMEHFITPELQEELRSQLTDPATDPHGRPIPNASQ
jgi:Mn-dependent DtxR family transcriptional regulator